jgi:hypothetical protein
MSVTEMDIRDYECPANEARRIVMGSIQTVRGSTPSGKLFTIMENTSFSPDALVTYPERLAAELREPVLARTLFSAGVPFIRFRKVPSTPATGNASRKIFA